MLALCEIRYDHYSRVANTCHTHSTRHFRLSRWGSISFFVCRSIFF